MQKYNKTTKIIYKKLTTTLALRWCCLKRRRMLNHQLLFKLLIKNCKSNLLKKKKIRNPFNLNLFLMFCFTGNTICYRNQ